MGSLGFVFFPLLMKDDTMDICQHRALPEIRVYCPRTLFLEVKCVKWYEHFWYETSNWFSETGFLSTPPAMCVACFTGSGQSRGCGLCPKSHYCSFIIADRTSVYKSWSVQANLGDPTSLASDWSEVGTWPNPANGKKSSQFAGQGFYSWREHETTSSTGHFHE